MWTRYAKVHPDARPNKVKVLFFDTETTGLPKDWKVSARDGPDNYPDIVSLAWILTDEDKTVLRSNYSLVKPEGWTIPADATAIHGITQEEAEEKGQHLSLVLADFWNAVRMADLVVAHNLRFDRNVVWGATKWKLNREPPEWNRLFCTMTASIHLCKLPATNGMGWYKFPKLAELYVHFFGRQPQAELHNSMEDTRVLVDCFFAGWNVRDLLASLDEKSRDAQANQNQSGGGGTSTQAALLVGRRRPARSDKQGSTTLQI